MADTAIIEVRAHRLASDLTKRVDKGRALGRPSLYNILREGLIEAFLQEEEDGS